jgi:hypothetical protein
MTMPASQVSKAGRGTWFRKYFQREVTSVLRSTMLDSSRIVEVTETSTPICSMIGSVDSQVLGIGAFLGTEETSASVADTHTSKLAPISHEFDVLLLNGSIDQCPDVAELLDRARSLSKMESRLVIVSYSRVWQPIITLATSLHLRTRHSEQNWIPTFEIQNILEQCRFEIVTRRSAIIFPFPIPIISRFLNRWLAALPVIRSLALVQVTIARPIDPPARNSNPSLSILIPARNEAGNIEAALKRIPRIAPFQEIIFVEGNSTDNTWECIQSVNRRAHDFPAADKIISIQQPGIGKGDAVRAGFSLATGDVLSILDADLTMPPEELGKFYRAIATDTCEFANGSRLLYPMEDESMQFLNLVANRIFGMLFTFLLGQPVRDTLCGTKMLRRANYELLAAHRSYFGALDPFGDFDLLFGAARMSLRIRDIPIHYRQRTYGSTNISRFSHGILLIRMCGLAARRIRFS